MKKIAQYTFAFIVISSIIAFTVRQVQIEKKVADQESILGILYQQKAAEYKALCLQAYHIAQLQIDAVSKRKGKHKPYAIITDLDETALDNSPGEAYAYQQDRSFVPDLMMWWLHGKPKAVPGSIEFFQYAAKKGFHIYYISNRLSNPAVIDSTREQMRRLGFPHTENKGRNSLFLFQPAGIPTKQPRRDLVTSKGDTIILLLGDNLIDINSRFDKINGKYQSSEQRLQEVDEFKKFWGTKYVVFPNAYYGDWESTFYQEYNNTHPTPPTIAQKYAIRDSLIQVYNYRKK